MTLLRRDLHCRTVSWQTPNCYVSLVNNYVWSGEQKSSLLFLLGHRTFKLSMQYFLCQLDLKALESISTAASFYTSQVPLVIPNFLTKLTIDANLVTLIAPCLRHHLVPDCLQPVSSNLRSPGAIAKQTPVTGAPSQPLNRHSSNVYHPFPSPIFTATLSRHRPEGTILYNPLGRSNF